MKKEYIILVLVIVAMAAYLVMHNTDSTHYTLPALDDLGETDIDLIDISRGDTTLTLKTDGSSWTVGEDKLPASEDSIKTMIDSIKTLSLTALVSESKSYNRYELDDPNKITITSKNAGKTIRIFEVGKVAASFRHTFVKLENDTNVYHAAGNLKKIFDKTVDDLANKQIMTIDRTKVSDIEAQEALKTLTLSKKQEPVSVDVANVEKDQKTPVSPTEKDIWSDASGTEKASDKVNAFISEFTNLKCEGYITGKSKADFTEPLLIVTLNADKPYTLSIFPKTEGVESYSALSSESDFPFTLPSSKVDAMIKKLGDI